MSKPESISSKVLLSNSAIGLAITAFVAGSLFYIYVIHVHIVHLQELKLAAFETAETYTDSRQNFRLSYQKFNHGIYTLSKASEQFLQASLENQALNQYTQCKPKTHVLWDSLLPLVESKVAELETMTWNSSELSFELHTEQEQMVFDLFDSLKADRPELILHLDQVSHLSNQDREYSVINGRLSHEVCTGGQE